MTPVLRYLFTVMSIVLLINAIQAIPLKKDKRDAQDMNDMVDGLALGSVLTDSDILQLSSFLIRMLEVFQSRPLPLIYVEDIPMENPIRQRLVKRQYLSNRPKTTNRYICQPTREDIFKLLLALQDMRRDVPDKAINFCNLQRPTGAIFTNMRLLRSRDTTTPIPPR